MKADKQELTYHHHGLTISYLYFPAEVEYFEGRGNVEVSGPEITVLSADYRDLQGVKTFLGYLEHTMFPDSLPICQATQFLFQSVRDVKGLVDLEEGEFDKVATRCAYECIKELVANPPDSLLEDIGVSHG